MAVNLKKWKLRDGFAILGVTVALAILGAMAFGLVQLVASNSAGVAAQKVTAQDFYIAHAAIEHAMRRIKVDGDTTSVPSLEFLSSPIGVTLNGGRISSATSFGSGRYTASNAFSVANPSSGAPAGCIYVLSKNASYALDLTGSGSITSPRNGIYVNSTGCMAINIGGSGGINSYFVDDAGDVTITGTGAITTHSGSVTPITSPVADPLASYDIPTYTACTHPSTMLITTNTTLNPGVYCGGISITGSPTVTLNPGNYIIDGGSFSSTGSATISGTGVTIFLNKQLQSSYPTFNLTMTGGSVTLSAPTSGPYAGIAIFQSRKATSSGTNSIIGTTSLQITGVVYFPNQALTYVGGSTSNPPCTMIVANTMSVTGSANVSCTTGSLSGLVH